MPTEMEVENTVEIEEMKRCLRDAGMYEENMNDDEIKAYYNAVKSSENTFVEDIHNRSEIVVSEIEKDSQNDVPAEENNRGSKKSEISTENDEDGYFDPFNCAPVKHKPLEVIYREPKYDLAPHVNPALLRLPVEERTRIIIDFQAGLLHRFYEAHRKAKVAVPLGKVIQSSDKFNGTMERKGNSNVYDFYTEALSTETYVLRSGRQTKRKVYSDAYDSDNEKKKSKKDDEKEKEEYRPTSVTKRTAASSTPKTNQEIIKRSRFFAETPNSSRSEKMFDQLVASEKKRQKDEEKIDKFHASLPKVSDDEEEDVVPSSQPKEVSPLAVPIDDVVIIEEVKRQDTPMVKRRVPPPLRGRRGLGARGKAGPSSYNPEKAKLLQSPPPLARKPPSPQSPSVSMSDDIQPSQSFIDVGDAKQKANTKGKTKCPICSDLFHTDEIEAHASNCGLGMENSVTFESIVDGNVRTIKCNVCDKDMPMSTDYEAHVNECMRKVGFK